jgi:hypothetical protein
MKVGKMHQSETEQTVTLMTAITVNMHEPPVSVSPLLDNVIAEGARSKQQIHTHRATNQQAPN